jgi:Ni/Co efflux regulator RcnB
MLMLVFALLVGAFGPTAAPRLTAAEIMARVATNQDRDQQARNQFVYDRKVHRTMRRKDGKLLQEEYWTFAMTPGPRGTEKKLLSVQGRHWKHGQYLPFSGEPVPDGLLSITLDDEGDSKTRDGIDKDLFPLTTAEQKKYAFELLGERVVNGRPAYQTESVENTNFRRAKVESRIDFAGNN